MHRPTLLAALLAVACNENELSPFDGADGNQPRIEVTPPQLDFGTLKRGEESVRTYTITNVGEAELEVEAIRLDADPSFRQLTDMDHFYLPPGASQEIEVSFTPMGSHEQLGEGIVLSNDPVDELAGVELVGFGAVPELAIDPPTFDFGTGYVGCGDEVEILLANVGTDDLVITDVAYADLTGQLTLDASLSLPLTLAPGQGVPVWVEFSPTSDAPANGSLSVTSNDPRGVVSATQEGQADWAAWVEEAMVVPTNPPVDILFAVDQSCSMDAHATQLGSSFSALISGIQQVTTGWRIGVVTADHACFNGGVLHPATPSLLSKFQSAVSYGDDGTPGFTFTEKLFKLTQLALGKTVPGQCNQNFLRPQALLHVVLVSDEREQSGITPSAFLTALRSYKASADLVKVSGIICDPGGCGHDQGYDTGYADAVAQGGGVRANVMSSSPQAWAQYAQDIAEASVAGLNRFELTQTADGNSLEVWVDGVPWPSGWHFDPVTNELVFDVEPPEGADVDVQYGALVNCP